MNNNSLYPTRERGSTVVLMAISMAVLVLFISGIVVFGTAFITSTSMNNSDTIQEYTHLVETEELAEVEASSNPAVGAVVGAQPSELEANISD